MTGTTATSDRAEISETEQQAAARREDFYRLRRLSKPVLQALTLHEACTRTPQWFEHVYRDQQELSKRRLVRIAYQCHPDEGDPVRALDLENPDGYRDSNVCWYPIIGSDDEVEAFGLALSVSRLTQPTLDVT